MSNVSGAEAKVSLKDFPKVFWVANLLELFERAAYYGLHAVLARYLTDKVGGGLGYSADEAGLLQSVVYAVTYLVPILGGALADRYGYRRMLLVAFSLLSVGYFISGYVTTYSAIFASLLVMAVGAGTFKPMISGTIARVTDERTSGLGFGIFYWVINLGAFVAPFVAGVLKLIAWKYVFIASSAYSALMFIPVLLLYRDPPMPKSTKKLSEVLDGALMVLSDARFVLFIFVYSTFWILYFQNYGLVLWYLRDFQDMTPVDNVVNAGLRFLGAAYVFKFDAEHVTSLNALTIILLQISISKVFSKFSARNAMASGMIIGALGFAIVGLSATGGAWLVIIGIMVFTLGELICHPRFISYVGLIAPPDKKALYIGYSFLYGVIGGLIGGNLGGEIYTSYITPVIGTPEGPTTMRNVWFLFAGIGVLAMVLLLMYGRIFGVENEVTKRRARKVMLGLYGFFVVASGAILYNMFTQVDAVVPKTLIQSSILLFVGIGGSYTLMRKAKAPATGGQGEK